jgi:hypothetical protein
VSDVALFTVGTLVFFLGATGLALFGLDTFRIWGEVTTDLDDGFLTPDEAAAEVARRRADVG